LREENESVALAFSQAHPDFEALPAAPLLAEQDQGASLCVGDYLRLWPHKHQTDGFFAAVWQRR
jgi:16S rRNA (cytosine967-C5)-methyltransferase